MWPTRWDTVTEIRHITPDGSVVKVTVEREVATTGDQDTIGEARMAAKLAALAAFTTTTTEMAALITPAVKDGTDPDTRLFISTYSARRKERR